MRSSRVKMESCSSFAAMFNCTVILTCTIVLTFQGRQCVERYVAANTKATLSLKSTRDMTFPAFTICPEYHSAYNKAELQKLGIDKPMAYKTGYFYGNLSSGTSDVDANRVFEDLNFSLDEIIKKVIVYTIDSGYVNVELNSSSEEASWILKYDQSYGKCYSMELLPTVTDLGIVNIRVITHMSIYIYIHHPGQYMDVDTKAKVYATKGKLMFIDVAHEISENTLEAEGEIPCNRTMDFSYDECGTTKIADILLNEFGCIVPWLPQRNEDGFDICRFDFNTEAGREFRSKVMNRYHILSTAGTRNLCSSPCTVVKVFLGLPFFDTGKEDKAYLKMYFKSMVKYKKAMLDYTWLSMLAEIGGYTGLLLGISIVDVAGIIKRSLRRFGEK